MKKEVITIPRGSDSWGDVQSGREGGVAVPHHQPALSTDTRSPSSTEEYFTKGYEAAKVTAQAASPIEDIDLEIEVTAVALELN
jgi:hypothetical protein